MSIWMMTGSLPGEQVVRSRALAGKSRLRMVVRQPGSEGRSSSSRSVSSVRSHSQQWEVRNAGEGAGWRGLVLRLQSVSSRIPMYRTFDNILASISENLKPLIMNQWVKPR